MQGLLQFFFFKISTRIHATAYDEGTHAPVDTGLDDPTAGPFQPRIYVHDQIPSEKVRNSNKSDGSSFSLPTPPHKNKERRW